MVRRHIAAGATVLALACTMLAGGASTAAAARWVGYPTILAELRTGPLIRVIINRPPRHIEIKFRNLDEWEAVYPVGAEHGLQRLIHSRGIKLIFASSKPGPHAVKPAAVHHRLRYITAGVLLLLLAAGGAWALVHRREARRREAAERRP